MVILDEFTTKNEHDITFLVDITCDLDADTVPDDVVGDGLLEDMTNLLRWKIHILK